MGLGKRRNFTGIYWLGLLSKLAIFSGQELISLVWKSAVHLGDLQIPSRGLVTEKRFCDVIIFNQLAKGGQKLGYSLDATEFKNQTTLQRSCIKCSHSIPVQMKNTYFTIIN